MHYTRLGCLIKYKKRKTEKKRKSHCYTVGNVNEMNQNRSLKYRYGVRMSLKQNSSQ